MKLTRARVRNYKSIDDSSWVNIEDITALVGKNESGKTAFLQALRKINSISGDSDGFNIHDYPRKGYIKYKKVHDANPSIVAQAEFELSGDEINSIEKDFGIGVLKSNLVIVGVDYKNQRHWDIDIAESSAVSQSSNGNPNFSIPSAYSGPVSTD